MPEDARLLRLPSSLLPPSLLASAPSLPATMGSGLVDGVNKAASLLLLITIIVPLHPPFIHNNNTSAGPPAVNHTSSRNTSNPLFATSYPTSPSSDLHISTRSPAAVDHSGEYGEFAGGMDVIECARWDVLGDRRFLILAYPAGLQIWDCSDLSAILEVLNLNFNSAEWKMILGNGKDGFAGRQEEGMMVQVIHAALLPEARSGMKDPFSGDRPLLGISMQMDHIEDRCDDECDSSFVLYSLRKHQVVKRLALSGSLSTFTTSDQFIIISMTSPPALLVLSSTTFQTLHIVLSTSLEPFSPLPHHSTTAMPASSAASGPHSPQSSPVSNTTLSIAPSPVISNKFVPLARLSIDNTSDNISGNYHRRQQYRFDVPHPIFALSHRLLAYADPSPSSSPLHVSSAIKPSHRLSSPSSTPSNPNSSLSSSPLV